MAQTCSAPVAPTEHVAAPDVHVDSAPGLNSGGSWMGDIYGAILGRISSQKVWKMVGDIILKKMLLIFVEGYPRLPVMPSNVLRQPQAAVRVWPSTNGNGRKVCPNKTCKARVAGRVKAQPVLQLYIRLGVWLHPCQYYRPSSDMPAVRHEFLSIYQMAWVKSGKDEQGRRLLVTTMLHPSMKILVPHRIHRCERWRTAVWGSTGRVVPPKAGLSHPGMPRQAASCRGAVEAQNWANLVSGWPWLP